MVTNKVAAIQLVSGPDIRTNLKRAAFWIEKAVARGAQLIVLPENFALLESKGLISLGEQEMSETGEVRSALATLAKTNNVWLIAGSLPCACRPDGTFLRDRVRSVCWVFDPHGEIVARYDKIHLFDVDVEDEYANYRESLLIEPGDEAVVVETPLGVVGLSVCYDLRFPELYRKLVEKGAELMVVPAAFTAKTGEAHWETLLKARAIENQVYVIAANQGGHHSACRETYGHSMIIDPWGRVVVSQDILGEGMVSAIINQEEQKKIRKAMPVLLHRRF